MVALLLITPLYRYIQYPWIAEYVTGLAVTIGAWALAVGIYYYLSIGRYVPWIGFVSAALDVSLVSLALFTFVIVGPPHAAANSRVTFDIYFLALAGASLRYDRRICLVAGMLSVVEYVGVVIFESSRWGFNNPLYEPFTYGTVSWADQFSRVVFLVAATFLSSEIVRRAEHLRRVAVRDLLTDLPNRAYVESRGRAELSRARRYGQPLVLAMIDVDRFKSFNDRFGHATGDRVLSTIATVLQRNVRVSDVVARYGGEEFIVLLPQTPLDQGVDKIDMLRLEVAATGFPITGRKRTETLTISAGIASFPADAHEFDALLVEADRRLLRAKAAGRNRVVAE